MRLSSRPNPPRTRTADYSSRRVQLRLVMLVFSVMTVLLMMHKAGQPETWSWMNFQDSKQQESSPPIDTRATFEADPGRDEILAALVKTVPSNADTSERVEASDKLATSDPDAPLPGAAESQDDFELAERDFWKKIYEELSLSEKTVFFQLLRSALHNETLAAKYASRWADTAAIIQKRRQKYYATIMEQVESLGEDQVELKKRWLNTMQRMQDLWDQSLEPCLRDFSQLGVLTVGTDHRDDNSSQTDAAPDAAADLKSVSVTEFEITQQQRAQVRWLLEILHELALATEEDNALTSRKRDMQAWFGLFDRMRRADLQALKAESMGNVNYAQLFQQPDFYRGKVIDITGEVRCAYWEKASENPLNIERYYVFWIRPDDGSNNPIVVYTLEPPAGFPPIGQFDEDSYKEDWREPVEVSGYFLRKMVYPSQDTTRLSPLLLAKQIEWKPVPAKQIAADLPSIPVILGTILALGLVAIALAMTAYRFSSKASYASTTRDEAELAAFNPQQISRQIDKD